MRIQYSVLSVLFLGSIAYGYQSKQWELSLTISAILLLIGLLLTLFHLQSNGSSTNPCRICLDPICHQTGRPCEKLEELLPSVNAGKTYSTKKYNENQAAVHGTGPELASATANTYDDYDYLRDIINKVTTDDRSAMFAAYLRCWSFRAIAEAANMNKSTVYDQLNDVLDKAGRELLKNIGSTKNYTKRKSLKEFKDIFNQGTYK